MTGQLTVVGTRVTRVDAEEKATGLGLYAPDLEIQGMVYGLTLRSPHPHARVVRVDSSRAEALPGFRGLVKASEVPRVCGTWFNLRSRKELGKLLQQDDKVRFIGDPVLVVAADDEDTAREAISLIDVEYEVLPAVFDPFEAMASEYVKIHDRGNVGFHIVKEYGDSEAGFAEAEVILEHRYVTSKQKHASLEPCGTCIAEWGRGGSLTLWSTTQVPHWTQMYLSLAMGIPIAKVRVIRPHVGGSFGARAGVIWGLELMCSALAREVGRPVKMEFTREEDFSATESRHPFTVDYRVGAKRDGTLVAADARIVMDVGGYGTHYVSVLADALGTGVGIYRIPNYRFEGTCVYTNKSLGGAFRGYGNPQMNFAQESALDELAAQLGIDPVEMRLKNYRGAGEMDPVFEVPVKSDGMKGCLEEGASAMDWQVRRVVSREQKAESTLRRGVGMAAHQHGTGARFGLPDPSSAVIRINADASVDLLTACADDGQGNRTVLAQIAAEVLGVPFEWVAVSATDTAIAPLDGGTHGSRQTYCGGTAVLKAATEARESVMKLAAEYLERSPDSLTVAGGNIVDATSAEPLVGLGDLMRHYQVGDFSRCHEVIAHASGVTEDQPPVFGATFAEVEVDVETGQVRVIKMVGAFDVGKAINPAQCEGQIAGGLTMGVGYALTEGLIIEDGRVLNPGYRDYKIPRAVDAPEVVPVLVESIEPTGPFGAKGLGEATMISSAAAIANAVYNAVGARIRELTITPEKVLAALREASQQG
ncbi:MAG: molybdopterin-dependent oxidoreductase [Actinobacteria bacterium]|nr:molybdopterin-dependent oxidoreductase [Actinomycetota bacterium]